MNRSNRTPWLRLCALAALMLLAVNARPAEAQSPAPASATASQPMLAIEITNTAAFWPKVADLPPVQGLTALLESPAVKADLGYQEFILARDKLTQSLGYPATMQEMFCNVFGRILLSVSSNPATPEPDVALAFGVKDPQKAAKLVQVFDKKYKDEATSSTAVGDSKLVFEQVTLEGATVSHYKQAATSDQPANEGYYGLVKDRLVYANSPGAFTRSARQPLALASLLASDADFATLRAPLAWAGADMVGWIDGDAFTQAAAGSLGPLAALANSNGAAKNKWALAFQVQPGAVLGKFTGTANPTLQSAKIRPGKLIGPALFAPQPVVAIDSRIFDFGKLVEQLRPMLTMVSAMQGTGGQGSPLDQFEQATGVSVDGELVPALGNEIILAFNSMQPSANFGSMPTVDLVAGLAVADEAKMAAVMGKIEKYIQQAASAAQASSPAAMSGGAATSVTFQTVDAGGAKIRTISAGMPGISPSYTIHQGMLLIGLSPENIQSALARKSGASASLTTDAGYQEIMAMAGNPPVFAYSTVDMARLVAQVLGPAAGIIAMQKPGADLQTINHVLNEIVARIGVGQGVAYEEKGIYTSLMKFKMQ